MAVKFDGGAYRVYGLGWWGNSEIGTARAARVVECIASAAAEWWTAVEGGVVSLCVYVYLLFEFWFEGGWWRGVWGWYLTRQKPLQNKFFAAIGRVAPVRATDEVLKGVGRVRPRMSRWTLVLLYFKCSLRAENINSCYSVIGWIITSGYS